MSGKIILRAPSGGSVSILVEDTAVDRDYVLSGDGWVSQPGIGVNQTWRNFTSGRVIGTTYTNNTGQAIMVAFSGSHPGATNIYCAVDNLQIATCFVPEAQNQAISFIVPNGSSYSIETSHGLNISNWSELRGA